MSEVSLLPIAEVARRTSLSEKQVRRLANAGKFPKPHQVSARRIRWRSDEVTAFIDACPEA